MNLIDETRIKIKKLRMDLQKGKVFASLGNAVGAIIDEASVNHELTEMELPDNQEEILTLLQTLRTKLGKGELDQVSDQELKILLKHLGSKNPLIRDQGVFAIFGELLQEQVLTKQQKIMVFDRLISDEMLMSHINEKENDAAFLRSYTMILLSTFIYIDRAGVTFIDSERKSNLVTQIALYIILENDTRGYIDNCGWVHAYTHIGNVLDELAEDDELIRADKIFLMSVLIEKYQRITTPLVFGEGIRLAVYLADQLFEDDVYQQFLLIELREWRRKLAAAQVRESAGMWNMLFNRQRLLQAMMLNPDMANSILEYLEDSNDFTF